MCRVCDCACHLAMPGLAFGQLFCFAPAFEVFPLSVLMGSSVSADTKMTTQEQNLTSHQWQC